MNKPEKELLIIILLILCLTAGLFSRTLVLRHYSIDEGMPDTFIKCIYQDSRGYLWFATPNGAGRFDGIHFRYYRIKDGLLDDNILAITQDSKGNIWLGTARGGASCISEDTVTNLTNDDGLVSSGVTSIVEDQKGNLWFGTLLGVCKFDGKRSVTLDSKDGLVSNSIFNMLAAQDGSLWFGTRKGISRFNGGTFINYTTTDGLADNNITHLSGDAAGRIYIGTSKGLTIFEKGEFRTFTTADGLGGNLVLSVETGPADETWIGTDNGLTLYSGGKFTGYTTSNGLPSNAVLSLRRDHEGNLWIGTTAGASYFPRMRVEGYSVKNGLCNNMVWDIIQDSRGNYWFGTEDGLSRYSRGTFKTFSRREGLVDNRVYGLLEDGSGKILIATNGGFSIYSGGRFTNYTQQHGLLSDSIQSLHQDSDGVVWIGTVNGLNMFRDGAISIPRFNGKALKKEVKKISEGSRGELWFSTPSGLYRLGPDRKTLTLFTPEEGLPHASVLWVFEDSKRVTWIGTQMGLSRFRDETFTNYSTRDGLPDNKCYFIREDHRGFLWIGTARGLARYNGTTFKTYSRDDGFTTENWSNSACFKDNGGALWLGGANGVTRFDPRLDVPNRIPPPVYITGIQVMNRDTPLETFRELAYNHNNIMFSFVGICLSSPHSVIYRYRLEGIDPEWRETGERQRSYPYLPPGDYRFLLKAVNNDDVESPTAVEIPFTIRSPFWKTWWFTALWVLAALSALAAVIYWRFKRIREKMELQARNRVLVMAQQMELLGVLAAGAVHDLKNLLSVILGYSKMAEKSYHREPDNKKSNVPIEKIKKTATTAIRVVKQILAFTRQKHDESAPANLVALLNDILDILNIIRPPDVGIVWEPPRQELPCRIDPIGFQQLVMNLCINAMHAMPEGGKLEINLTANDRRIRLEISDTGHGIDAQKLEKIFDPLFTTKEQEKGTGLGLFVVKQIVDRHNGAIDVHSEPGKGTKFVITFDPEGKINKTKNDKR